ncbi:HEPN domain-containing protein [Flavobacterium sp. CF136]|uniref:HEPN domain-containing protein n=1 Tax=Flavobacterium sp. (strain CF136) TaxID=1144313 RepID=UPI00027196BF|nr:HEPN domain-containing protein [Flavobacterium sp. CF136]EJL62838.1 hypothetical protein PMI10_02795 [Flavobacterium sp. CF136]
MQNLNLEYEVNPLERIFLDKSIECLFYNSIDSYRLRLHNPKSLIEELIIVINSSINGVLTNNEYVEFTSKELKKILEDDTDVLIFKSVSKKHYLDILSKPTRNNYKLIQQSSKFILKYNQDYFTTIFDEIYRILDSFKYFLNNKYQIDSAKEKELNMVKKRLIVLVDYFYIELLTNGFSKQYLYKIFQSIFKFHRKSSTNFDIQFKIFESIIFKKDENFKIIFAFKDRSFQFHELNRIDSSYFLIDRKERNKLKPIISEEGKIFLEKNAANILIGLEYKTKDHFKSVQQGIDKLSKDLDIYHLGYNVRHYKVESHCLTIAENEPLKSTAVPSNFQIDGKFNSNALVFNNLLEKIKKLQGSNIEEESYQKILSAIRYYRTGSESPELETKFLNYWIGLEFIFTSFTIEEKTINRIRDYFSKCHSLIYVKRNLFDFHSTLERLGVSSSIINYGEDMDYLLTNKTFEDIKNNTESELLKFRAEYFQKWYQEPNKIQEVIDRHQNNIKWNITRLYRIRNEIVHNAAIKNGIYTHISHLKYYLSFILNSILDFMTDNAVDMDNDGRISIEDYFVSQEILLGCLKSQKLEKWLEIEYPNQIFQ